MSNRTPIPVNWSVRQGETLLQTFTPLQDDGTIFDLTGAVGHFALATAPDTTPIIEGTTSGGQVSVNPTNGVVTITVAPSVTFPIAPATLVFDCFLLLTTGIRFCAAQGFVRIIGSATPYP